MSFYVARGKQTKTVFEGPTVTLKVGEDATEFYIHKDLFRRNSPYFRHQSDLRKNTSSFRLRDDIRVDDFRRLVQWLYARNVMMAKGDEWMSLCRLWLLGERFEISELKNDIINFFSARLRERNVADLDLEILHYIYSKSCPLSTLRKIFVHICVWYGNQDVFAQKVKEFPVMFQDDYSHAQVRKAREFESGESRDTWNLDEFLERRDESDDVDEADDVVETKQAYVEEDSGYGSAETSPEPKARVRN